MADWTINGIRIFVQEFNAEKGQIIARLQPLNGGTVLHFFGYDSLITKLSGYVVGLTDGNAILGLTDTKTSYVLTSPYSTTPPSYFVKSVSLKLQRSVCQTLRPDLDSDAPVYLAELELYLDE